MNPSSRGTQKRILAATAIAAVLGIACGDAGEDGDHAQSVVDTSREAVRAKGGTGAGGETGGKGGGPSGRGGTSGKGGGRCKAPNVECGNECVSLDADEANCGACAYECVHGRQCVSGRCTPAWQPLETAGAPSTRWAHAAGFVDGRYVVLGGSLTVQGVAVSSAAAYDVENDQWATLAPLGSARCGHQAVSTGTEILTFGGLTDCGNGTTIGPGLERFVSDGGVGIWSTLNVSGAPSVRYAFAATWTGAEFFLYGGGDNTLPTLATGSALSLAGPVWSDVSCSLTNCDRGGYGVVFTDGPVVRYFGGLYNPVYPTPPQSINEATSGLAFDLSARTWSAWPYPSGTETNLGARFADDGRRLYFLKGTNQVTIYDRAASSWLASDTAPMPAGFCVEAAAAWTGAELVAWSGSCGGAPVNVGGRYQPSAP